MYIEYITPQRMADPNFTDYTSNGGTYRPTRLIRASDWNLVPGTEAINGYCALSYCWEQSGDIVQESDKEEYTCIDKPGHKLIFDVEKLYSCNMSPKYITTDVTYEVILKQICKDFDIDYLWYDKLCLNQLSKAAKQREIKQMHLVYSTARYTVALVPEVTIDDPSDFERYHKTKNETIAHRNVFKQLKTSLWWTRSWTLEEMTMSTRVLVVGRNTHAWALAKYKQGNIFKERDILSTKILGFKDEVMKSANMIFRRAHFRTSSKEHDKVFALANIFDDLISIDIDYDIPISNVIADFYRKLAERDLSIFCFGSILKSDQQTPRYLSTMDAHGLPSWTGVAGIHAKYPVVKIEMNEHGNPYFIDDGMRLHIECRSCTVHPIQCRRNEILMDEEREQKAKANYHKGVTSMDDFPSDKTAALDWCRYRIRDAAGFHSFHYCKPIQSGGLCLPFMPLSLTEECDECVLLEVLFSSANEAYDREKGVNFTSLGHNYSYLLPVVKKSNDNSSAYRAVGACLVKQFPYKCLPKNTDEFLKELFDQVDSELEEFIIE